jgi:1,4-dihydroxy-6-naphthoate synthase
MISLAFSPCPNDTFIFDAIVNKRVDLEGLRFRYQMHDVESLNHMALQGRADMIKVSYHAWLYLQQDYVLLNSGSALGRGNGPLLIAKKRFTSRELSNLTVAIPGEYTTAHLLLKIAFPEIRNKRVIVFSAIQQAILSGEVEAGVIIHENRFTYEKNGLLKIADLGEYWENRMQAPVPLGGIVARKGLGYETINKLNRIMFRSVQYAQQHPEEAMPFVKANAQEMEESVMKQHINLYVNEHTLSLGDDGAAAIKSLMDIAVA